MKILTPSEVIKSSQKGVVQKSALPASGNHDIAISEIDPEKTAVLVTGYPDGQQFDANHEFTVVHLLDKNTLRVPVGEKFQRSGISWKLIEFENAYVQRGQGEFVVGSGVKVIDITINEVSPEKTFVNMLWRMGYSDEWSCIPASELISNNILRISVELEENINFYWEVVSFG